jgi:magnesium chelatase subunit D
MTPAPASPAWRDAALAAALFAIDPIGLGGVVVRAGPGAARDRWMAMIRALLPVEAPLRRIPLNIEDDRLLGGLDLSASLASGRPVIQSGVLAQSDGGVVILAMAERIETAAAARISAALDHAEVAIERDGVGLRLSTRIGVIALDEGLTPEERPPQALRDRLAFCLDLSLVGGQESLDEAYDAAAVAQARAGLAEIAPPDYAIVEALCTASQALGVACIRAPLLTLRAARAHAALQGRVKITAEDAAVASRLVLGPRALMRPAETPPDEQESQNHPEPAQPPDSAPDDAETPNPPPEEPRDGEMSSDRVVEAIQAALPDDLLDRISLEGQARGAAPPSRGGGAAAKSAQRGRPVGSRPGALRPGARLNLVETLRAAAPWQTLRKAGGGEGRIQVRQDDFRIRRFVQRLQSTTIFVVDASGSAAFQRLAEAKGAVELLLAKAYVSRARVALIAFRGSDAELLLPPTRSLTRAKARLAELPGGGGTPLAAGIEAAMLLAVGEAAKDHTPLMVFLTDGRANIARDGAPGRARADSDALEAAQRVRAAGLAAVFIDTSPRAQPDADRFARAMGGVYAPLPYVNASAMAEIVGQLQVGRS